jgi:hypothetical protein
MFSRALVVKSSSKEAMRWSIDLRSSVWKVEADDRRSRSGRRVIVVPCDSLQEEEEEIFLKSDLKAKLLH